MNNNFLAASSDGYVGQKGVIKYCIEIKCPYTARHFKDNEELLINLRSVNKKDILIDFLRVEPFSDDIIIK